MPGSEFESELQALQRLAGAPVVDVAVNADMAHDTRQNAIKLVAERAATVRAKGNIVPSPCISVCRIDAETNLCEGCCRTLDEIVAWSGSGPDAQRQLWQTIVTRMAHLQRPQP